MLVFNGAYSDVVLTTFDGTEFRTSKGLWAGFHEDSPVRKLIEGNPTAGEYSMPDTVSPLHFQAVVKWVHGEGAFEGTFDEAAPFVVLATELGVKGFFDAAEIGYDSLDWDRQSRLRVTLEFILRYPSQRQLKKWLGTVEPGMREYCVTELAQMIGDEGLMGVFMHAFNAHAWLWTDRVRTVFTSFGRIPDALVEHCSRQRGSDCEPVVLVRQLYAVAKGGIDLPHRMIRLLTETALSMADADVDGDDSLSRGSPSRDVEMGAASSTGQPSPLPAMARGRVGVYGNGPPFVLNPGFH